MSGAPIAGGAGAVGVDGGVLACGGRDGRRLLRRDDSSGRRLPRPPVAGCFGRSRAGRWACWPSSTAGAVAVARAGFRLRRFGVAAVGSFVFVVAAAVDAVAVVVASIGGRQVGGAAAAPVAVVVGSCADLATSARSTVRSGQATNGAAGAYGEPAVVGAVAGAVVVAETIVVVGVAGERPTILRAHESRHWRRRRRLRPRRQ